MSDDLISLKIEKDLILKVQDVAKLKNPLRKTEKYSEAVREALIEYVETNQNILNKENN